jgi:hypothetical protein
MQSNAYRMSVWIHCYRVFVLNIPYCTSSNTSSTLDPILCRNKKERESESQLNG